MFFFLGCGNPKMIPNDESVMQKSPNRRLQFVFISVTAPTGTV